MFDKHIDYNSKI